MAIKYLSGITVDSTVLVVDSANDRVGIGTASPVSPLDVNGIISSRNIFIAQNSGTYNLIYNASNSVAMYLGGSADPGNYYDNTNHSFRSIGGGTVYAVINSAGNVGIGTTSPSYKLQVQSDGAGLYVSAASVSPFTQDIAVFRYGGNGNSVKIENQGGKAAIQARLDNGTAMDLSLNASGGNVGIGTTSPGEKLDVAGTIRMSGTTYAANLGGINASWGGSSLYPTLFGETADRWVMHINPHISYVQTGINSYSGNTIGATIRFASNTSASSYWDAGVGVNSVGTDTFSIGREGVNFVKVVSGGNLLVGSSNNYTRVSVSNGISTRTGVTLSDGNTASLMMFAGASAPASISFDTFGLRFVGGSTVGTDNGSEFMRITTAGNVGIGTTAPLNKFSVIASNTFSYYNSSAPIAVFQGVNPTLLIANDNNTTDAASEIRLGNAQTTYYTYSPYIRALQGGGIDSYRLEFGTSNFAAATTRMTISAGGNVGIGTTSPTQKLEVNGSVLATSLIKSGGTSSQYLMADGSVSTTSNVAPRYVQTVNVSQTGYTQICTVSGNSLASAVNMSFQGTSGNVVVNVTAQILVNHFQDISIATTSGFYSQLNIRVISNNNETYSVEAQVISGAGATTDLNVEVFPLNSESVTFGGSPVTPGTTLVHTTRQGYYLSASEPMSISSGSDIYAAGNVGIGTTSPGYKLTLAAPAAADSDILLAGMTGVSNGFTVRRVSSSFVYSMIDGNLGVGTSSPNSRIEIAGTTGSYNSGIGFVPSGTGARNYRTYIASDGSFNFDDATAGATRINISSSGNVGIGTTSPASFGGYITQTIDGTSGSFTEYRQNGTALFRIGADGSRPFLYGMTNAPMDFYTNTNLWMRITGDGNVGIGTTSPTRRLHIVSSDDTRGIMVEQTLATSYAEVHLKAAREFRVGTGGSTSDVDARNRFYVYDSTAGAHRFTIDSSGNVGIGTTSPDKKLVVVGDGIGTAKIGSAGFGGGNYTGISFNGTLSEANYNILSSPTDATLYINRPSGVGIQFREANAAQMIIASGGNVGIGTTNPGAKLDVNGGIYANGDIRSQGIFRDYQGEALLQTNTSAITQLGSAAAGTGRQLAFLAGNAERMRITATGNVGIGTTSPGYKLDVATGNDNAIRILNSAGSNNNGLALSVGSGTPWLDFYGGRFDIKYNSSPGSWNSGSNIFLSILSSGNVGIGTTSPADKLVVYGAIRSTYQSSDFNAGGVSAIMDIIGASKIVRIGSVTGGDTLTGSEGSIYFLIRGNPIASFDVSGNLGIGTTSPDEKLHVFGNLKVSGQTFMTSGFSSYTTDGLFSASALWNGVITPSGVYRIRLGYLDQGGGQYWGRIGFVANTNWSLGTSQGGNSFSIGTGNGNNEFLIDNAGNVGIGTTSPNASYRTTITTGVGQTGALQTTGSVNINSGALAVGSITPSGTAGRIDASNDIVAFSTSDNRLKENVTPIANALDKVKSLTGVEFDWKEETKDVHGYEGHDIGVIAQEVEAVLPEAVRTNDSGYLSVRYEKMIALLIEANKELAARVEELEKKLK